jgi:hypothetical protein
MGKEAGKEARKRATHMPARENSPNPNASAGAVSAASPNDKITRLIFVGLQNAETHENLLG